MIQLFDLAGHDPMLRFSPYCWRVKMALAHKSQEPTTIAWRFHEKAALPGAPGNQKVPVLVDSGIVVSDSTSIALHLEHRYADGPSLFGGPGGEAHIHFILAWADSILMTAMAPIVAPRVLPHLHPADKAYFRSSRERRFGSTLEQLGETSTERLPAFRDALAPLRMTLAKQPFLGGDEPSYADYGVFGCFQWARCVGTTDLLATGDTLDTWLTEMLNLFGGLARDAMVAGAT